MSGEQYPIKRNVTTDVEVWREPHATEQTRRFMGKKALAFDGFVPLGEVESPFSYMRDELEARVIGQTDAIDAIIEALERTEMRMPDDKRPIANFAFLGPSGVGKTELAKSIATVLSGGKLNLIKIDGAAYSHGHEVAALIGSPNGFRDSGAPVVFSKENIEKPGTVLLIDEVEKASPELFNLMLSIMDDGEIQTNTYTAQDSKGEEKTKNPPTSFRNVIIVFTSNEGSEDMARLSKQQGTGFSVTRSEGPKKEELEDVAIKKFKKFFRPEFINRFNKMIVFHSLNTGHLYNILDVKLNQLNIEYQRQLGVNVTLSPATCDFLVKEAAKEPEYGARPLVRAIEGHIQTRVGRYLGADAVGEGTQVRVFHTSEAPDNYIHTNDSELIFTMKRDANLKKQDTILRELQASKSIEGDPPQVVPNNTINTVVFQAPVNPEDVYETYYHPDDNLDPYYNDEEYADDDIPEKDIHKVAPINMPNNDDIWKRPVQGTLDELLDSIENNTPDENDGDDDDDDKKDD